jgi:hypothetical protein
VSGDPYGGQTFKNAFLANGITFDTVLLAKTELFEALEPRLNSGEILLIDDPKLREQLLGLRLTSTGKIDVRSGEHDDFANAAAGALWLARPPADPSKMTPVPPVIVPMSHVSPALVNLHGYSAWGAFDKEW